MTRYFKNKRINGLKRRAKSLLEPETGGESKALIGERNMGPKITFMARYSYLLEGACVSSFGVFNGLCNNIRNGKFRTIFCERS